MLPCVAYRLDLALGTPGAESRADDQSVKARKRLCCIVPAYALRVDESYVGLAVVICSRLDKSLPYALVGILKVVFAYKSYSDALRCILVSRNEVPPRLHLQHRPNFEADFAEYGGIQSLSLHVQRHFVDGWQVLALYHAVLLDIAE